MKTILLGLGSLLFLAPGVQAPVDEFNGKPVFGEGVELGYYIWRDNEHWHMRWTTKGVLQSFTGAVTAEGGELKSLKRIDVEEERRVLYPGRAPHVVRGPRGRVVGVRGGRAPVVVTKEQDHIDMDGDQRIVFATKTDDDIDGFDFKVDDKVTELRFVLNVNGNPHPAIVQYGQNNQKARGLPLIVRIR